MRYVRMLSLSLKAHVAERGEEASAEVVDLWREPKKGPVQPERYSRPEKPDKVKKRKRLLVPRSEIPWFPVIKPDLRNGCGDCRVLCKPGVFEPGPPDPNGIQRPKLVVAHPYNCLVLFCTRCMPICTSGAILLPPKENFKRFVEYVD